MRSFIDNVMKSCVSLDKNDPVIKYFENFQDIVIKNDYNKRPYLNSTENMQYMRNLLDENVKNAFVVAGGSDPIFELLASDVLNIDAVDINEMEKPIFTLKKAAFRTLNNSDYENFFLDRENNRFFSPEIFEFVKDGFDFCDEIEKRFWDIFFRTTDREEIKEYFFKGGLEACSIDIVRRSLLFTKKRYLYNKIKNNLENAHISFDTEDAIGFLLNKDKNYDYVDITNIFLFIKQIKTEEEFKNCIKNLKSIYENKINSNGILVLDYMFGISPNDLNTGILSNRYGMLYQNIYEILNLYFDFEIMNVEAIPHATPLNGKEDTILYIRRN